MVRNLLHNGNVGEALQQLERRAEGFIGEGFSDRIENCRTEYRYMSDFMMKGYCDPRRNELFAELMRRILEIDYDLRVRETLWENPYTKTWTRRMLTSDTSAETLQGMLRATAADATAHYDALSLAFMSLLTSYHWRSRQADSWAAFFASPTTSVIDATTLTSAIMLSAMQQFSLHKCMCLAQTYHLCTCEEIRQRALTGCLLSLVCAGQQTEQYREETATVLSYLLADEDSCRAALELQMQMSRCAKAESDATAIKRDIMPTLLRNQPFRVTREGIVERNEEAEERLNPGSTYKGIEEMEEGIKKMLKMQEQGADIFFSGFKQMKRYPFFYKLTNWFMPFYMEHPDIARETAKLNNSEFVERVTKRGPFCDSDKYSFLIAIAGVMDGLPEKIRSMMEGGELGPIGMPKDDDSVRKASFLRLQYLQDLYRFYELNPLASSLQNPFSLLHSYPVWTLTAGFLSSEQQRDACNYIMRHDPDEVQLEAFRTIANSIADKSSDSYLLCMAEYHMKQKDYAAAIASYEDCMKCSPSNPIAMRGIARACYATGEYKKAAFYFDALHTLFPKRQSHLLNYAMAMVRDGKAEDILNDLYRLEYENPDDVTIRNTLGWALLYAGKAEQALQQYRRLADSAAKDSAVPQDFSIVLNHAYALLFTGSISEATDLLRSYASRYPSTDTPFRIHLLTSMQEDSDLLALYSFGRAEQVIISENLDNQQ